MARKRTKAAKQAQTLLVWLESLNLPTRVINALRRDLEVVTGEREDEDGGVLAGFDQARFTEELYQKRGGQVGRVPSVAASAVEALRAAIPAPVSADEQNAEQPARGVEAAAEAAPERVETPEEATAPEEIDAATDAPGAQEEVVVDVSAEPVVEAAEPSAGAAPVAVTAQADTSPDPKRRGRPPRAAADLVTAGEPAAVLAAPAKRRGRPRRDEVASEAPAELPPRTRRARVTAARDPAPQAPAAPPAETPAPALNVPAAPSAADPSFDVLLRLWRELHPHGQRAAMHFMADLLVG